MKLHIYQNELFMHMLFKRHFFQPLIIESEKKNYKPLKINNKKIKCENFTIDFSQKFKSNTIVIITAKNIRTPKYFLLEGMIQEPLEYYSGKRLAEYIIYTITRANYGPKSLIQEAEGQVVAYGREQQVFVSKPEYCLELLWNRYTYVKQHDPNNELEYYLLYTAPLEGFKITKEFIYDNWSINLSNSSPPHSLKINKKYPAITFAAARLARIWGENPKHYKSELEMYKKLIDAYINSDSETRKLAFNSSGLYSWYNNYYRGE